jgi:hypothetical protein
MTKLVKVATYAELLHQAQEQLSREKSQIFELYPTRDLNKEAYAFSYLRAERVGMTAINRRLAELRWLPVHLDTSEEMLAFNRDGLKRWLKAALRTQPSSDHFGNDFIHAMTRCALQRGWASKDFNQLVRRTGQLFSELSCLVGIVYYCHWLLEHGIEVVTLTDPDDLPMTAKEFAGLVKTTAELQRWHDHYHPSAMGNARQAKPKLVLVSNAPHHDELAPV